MPTLAPTVHERLARCGTRVYVDGLVAGADVALSVDGTELSLTATAGAHTIMVPSLAPGAVVKARQDAGGGFSPFSPPVVVEDALVPPAAAPLLPAEVVACAHCVRVAGLVPGCDVEIFAGKTLVGTGVANAKGAACVHIDLSALKRAPGTLSGRMLVCGQPGPSAATPVVPAGPLPKPTIGDPVFGCQRVVPLASLVPGSRVRLESDTGDDLGGFCSCWSSVNFRVNRALAADENVRARALFEGTGSCNAAGPWSDWRLVVPPDDRITPEVLPALVEGDQVIRVDNQIDGASLVVKIRPDESQPAEEFGPRPASAFPESHDVLMSGQVTGPDAQARFSGFRIYDRAWRPKTHAWIHRARHNPFNRRWVETTDNLEGGGAPTSLSPALHERIARCLVNAFFQDALKGLTAYAGYMEGTILPHGIAHLPIFVQHSGDPQHVVDNFGDADEQFALSLQALSKTSNRKGQAVSASGAGLQLWRDVDHTALDHSPHNTLGVELSAGSPAATYASGTGGLSGAPTGVFALRLAQFYPDDALNPEGEAADLFVTLSGGGQSSTVRLGAVGQAPFPDGSGTLTVLRTVRLPLDAFLAANPAFDLATIQSVTLDLKARPTGHLLIDDLEFGD